jgi:hypothetical protein
MDRQFYKADLAAQTVAKVEQPDAISSADWAAEQPETSGALSPETVAMLQDRLTLTVPSDHNIVQALRTKQIYVVQKGDRSTEDIAEHMGHDRRDGSYLALANGYDPRNVKVGDVFYNTYVSPNDARLANAQTYPLERQAKLARNERRLQQEAAAGRQKAALEAALRIAEEEELRGMIGEPPSLETLANLAMMGMNNPAVQTALLNPDLGRKIPVTKTIFYQGVPFTVASGLHEIGSQPEINADWSANSMVVDMVDIQTPSEIANRTGQSDYLNLERYMKRFPSSSLEGYFQYRAGADRETIGAWDRYTNAFNIGSLIAQGTMLATSFPALENPIGFGLSYYASEGAGRAVNYLTGSDFFGMLAENSVGPLAWVGVKLFRGIPRMTERRALIGAAPIQKGGTVVNPDACMTNCIPVARMTDRALRGNFANPATAEPWAAASQPGRMVYPAKDFKTKRSTAGQEFNSGVPWRDLDAVQTDMLSRPNSTAVIVGYRNPVTLPDGTVSQSGHAFNAVNYNGRVFYVDGQSGDVFNAKQMVDVFMHPENGYFQGVHVVPTGKLNFWVPSYAR